MTMIASSSWASAALKLNSHLPSDLYLRNQNLPTRARLLDTLIVESDGDYWFNSESAAKAVKLDGLTERQLNVKLCTGHTTCPKCSHDLACGSGHDDYGFFDFDVDNVRIQHQFACKKCRFQWGPKASGPKDSSLVAEAAPPRGERVAAPTKSAYTPPAGGSVTGRVWEIADEVRTAHPNSDWKTLRAAVCAAGEAAGIHPATVATQVAKWRKGRGIA